MSGLTITKKHIEDIETIAEYFGSNNNTVLDRLIAHELDRIRPLLKAKQNLENSARQPSSEELPKIQHSGELQKSKPMEGEFAGIKIWNRNWRDVTLQILKILCEKKYIRGGDLTTQLPAIANINIAQGVRDDSGYIAMPDLGISVQGLSAPRVGDFIQKVAEYYKIPYSFKVRWNISEAGDSIERMGLFASI